MGLFSKTSIGMDIGHASIRLVGVGGLKHPAFIGCIEVAIAPRYLQKEGFEDYEYIANALRKALQTAKPSPLKGKDIYVAISESLIFRKLIEIPSGSSGVELDQVIRNEAVQYLPESPTGMELDYQILGDVADAKLTQVMLVAAHKKTAEDILSVIMAAGLSGKAFEPKPESLGRFLVPSGAKKSVLLVDIGHTVCTVSAYDQGIVKVTSAINIGIGDDIAATESKKEMPKLIEQLADEVTHVRKFYVNRTQHSGEIESVLISGAGSLLEGLLDAFSKAIDLPVSKNQSVITVPSICDRRFYGALGAALYPWQSKL